MIMSVHEAIGKTEEGIFQAGLIDFPQEIIPVIVLVENGFPSVPSGNNVVHCIFKRQPQRSRHIVRLPQKGCYVKN
jgi:hypothetical protein